MKSHGTESRAGKDDGKDEEAVAPRGSSTTATTRDLKRGNAGTDEPNLMWSKVGVKGVRFTQKVFSKVQIQRKRQPHATDLEVTKQQGSGKESILKENERKLNASNYYGTQHIPRKGLQPKSSSRLMSG